MTAVPGRKILLQRIAELRADELRLTRDAVRTAEVFAGPGRPAAVDAFIESLLDSAAAARRAAAEAERHLERLDDGG